MASNVVKLKPDKRRIDLRGNNRFKDLLETRAEQMKILAEAKKRKDEADKEIREIMGDAESARADDYWVTITTFQRAEFVMPACTINRLSVRRGR